MIKLKKEGQEEENVLSVLTYSQWKTQQQKLVQQQVNKQAEKDNCTVNLH